MNKRFFPQHIVFAQRGYAIGKSEVSKISQAIKEDHRQLEYYYSRIVKAQTEDDKVRYQNAFVWELARHSIGEELVVYPVFESKLPNGKEMADKDRNEHQTVR
jgi:hemerythrin superfamily protein